MSVVCTRFAGSLTTSCACAGGAMRLTTMTINRSRRNIGSSLSERVRRPRRHVCRQLDIASEVHLHSVPLADGDCWKPVEKSVHHLKCRLGGRIAHSSSDDDGSIAIAAAQSSASQVLRQPTDETDCCRRSERGQEVLIHLVA